MATMTWQARAIMYMQKYGGVARKLPHYRCGQCRSRRRLNQELWHYVKAPKCKNCGAVDWRYDYQRYKDWKNKTGNYSTCHCDGLHHPHRKASSVWCKLHPTGPTDEDYGERHGQ